jgi:hypothetical protein
MPYPGPLQRRTSMNPTPPNCRSPVTSLVIDLTSYNVCPWSCVNVKNPITGLEHTTTFDSTLAPPFDTGTSQVESTVSSLSIFSACPCRPAVALQIHACVFSGIWKAKHTLGVADLLTSAPSGDRPFDRDTEGIPVIQQSTLGNASHSPARIGQSVVSSMIHPRLVHPGHEISLTTSIRVVFDITLGGWSSHSAFTFAAPPLLSVPVPSVFGSIT